MLELNAKHFFSKIPILFFRIIYIYTYIYIYIYIYICRKRHRQDLDQERGLKASGWAHRLVASAFFSFILYFSQGIVYNVSQYYILAMLFIDGLRWIGCFWGQFGHRWTGSDWFLGLVSAFQPFASVPFCQKEIHRIQDTVISGRPRTTVEGGFGIFDKPPQMAEERIQANACRVRIDLN